MTTNEKSKMEDLSFWQRFNSVEEQNEAVELADRISGRQSTPELLRQPEIKPNLFLVAKTSGAVATHEAAKAA